MLVRAFVLVSVRVSVRVFLLLAVAVAAAAFGFGSSAARAQHPFAPPGADPDSVRIAVPLHTDTTGIVVPVGGDSIDALLDAAPDSVRIVIPPDSAEVSPPPSGVPVRSDSTRLALELRSSWRDARLRLRPATPPIARLGRVETHRSVEDALRPTLAWESPLRHLPGGTYHLPDPVGWGAPPGLEPPALLIEGLPVNVAGVPEAPTDPVGLAWLDEAVLRPYDPLAYPSNPTGGPILELDLVAPDTLRALSEARLTSGSHGTYTEEFYLARPSENGLFRIFYHDHKTDGRFPYGSQAGQNLSARFDRGTRWGGFRLAWTDNVSRVRLWDPERWVWNRSAWEAGVRRNLGRWDADLSASAIWEDWRWEDFDGPWAIRKEALGRALLRLRGPELGAGLRTEEEPAERGSPPRLRPLATLEIDRQHQRYFQPGILSLDRVHTGIGAAAGIEGEYHGWRLRASAGRSAPAYDRSGWIAAVDLARRAGLTWEAWVHADRAVRPPLLPRLSNELGLSVAQNRAAAIVDADRPLETIGRWEAGARGRAGPAGVEVLARAVQIGQTLSGANGALAYFDPDAFASLSPDAFEATVRTFSVLAAGTVDLGWGFELRGEAAVHAGDPAWDEQFWMSPWDARARLAWRGVLFRGDLHLELFARGALSGRRGTPWGELPSSDRYDAGATATVESLTLFFLLRNLESDESAAAARYEGLWATRPLRSFRMGLVWRFWD